MIHILLLMSWHIKAQTSPKEDEAPIAKVKDRRWNWAITSATSSLFSFN